MAGMRQITIENTTRPLAQPIRAKYCASFVCQLRGLTFRRKLNMEEGLLLVQKRESVMDSAIHMLAVGMELAVIWIDSRLNVVDIRLAHPWRLVYVPKKPARYVLEISASRLDEFKTGDKLDFRDPNHE